MKKQGIDFHERDPHFDGRNEGIIANPLGGEKTGIRSDIDPNNIQKKNPFGNIEIKEDKEMDQFKKIFE